VSTSNLEASFARAARDYESRTDERPADCAGCPDGIALPDSGLCEECQERATDALDHELSCNCAEKCRWLSRTMDRVFA